jgi:flagellar biosynthesis protein FlhB
MKSKRGQVQKRTDMRFAAAVILLALAVTQVFADTVTNSTTAINDTNTNAAENNLSTKFVVETYSLSVAVASVIAGVGSLIVIAIAAVVFIVYDRHDSF